MTDSPRIEFSTLAGTVYEFPAPEWRYRTKLRMARMLQPVLPEGYVVWDNGVANDYRSCQCSWMLDATDAASMNDLFREPLRGRYLNVWLTLPRNSGFYPFGPDLGDHGHGRVRVTAYAPAPAMEEPYLHFRPELTMVAVDTWPSTALTPLAPEGDLQIGLQAGLAHPPDWVAAETQYDVASRVTGDGTPYTIDAMADRYEATIPMVLNRINAGRLVNFLRTTDRDTALTITAQANSYVFGRDLDGAGAYSCYWLDEELEITHEGWDRFTLSPRFYRIP